MKLIRATRIALLMLCAFSLSTAATAKDEGLRYFVIMAKPSAEIWDALVSNPENPVPAAKEFLKSIEGAKLIDYYLLAGQPKNLAIVALPDSRDASAILYQRMATQLVDEIEIFEVIPGNEFVEVLAAAKALRRGDTYSNQE